MSVAGKGGRPPACPRLVRARSHYWRIGLSHRRCLSNGSFGAQGPGVILLVSATGKMAAGIACSWVSIRIYFRNSDDYVPRTAERLPGGAAQRELGKVKSAKTKAKKLFVFNEYAK